MRLIFVTNEIVWLWCRQFKKEIRHYLRESDNCYHPDNHIFNTNGIIYETDDTIRLHRYFEYPSETLITDKSLVKNLDEHAYYPWEFYIVEQERCLKTGVDADGNDLMIRVQGYEKRRACDNSTILYQERWVKNTSDPEYHIGDKLSSIGQFEKVKCIWCCA